MLTYCYFFYKRPRVDLSVPTFGPEELHKEFLYRKLISLFFLPLRQHHDLSDPTFGFRETTLGQ